MKIQRHALNPLENNSLYCPHQNSTYQKHSSQDIPEESVQVQNIQEIIGSEQDASGNGSSAASGDADNFDIYYHPELQETTDKFVLNTDGYIFRLPKCDDVTKMAYENYATSNDSYEKIKKRLHYRPCGLSVKILISLKC